MLRKRVVGAFVVLAGYLGASWISPRVAHAQEGINLDDDSPAPAAKAGAKPGKKGKAAKEAAKKEKEPPAKKGSVNIDLDEGAAPSGDSGGGTASGVKMSH